MTPENICSQSWQEVLRMKRKSKIKEVWWIIKRMLKKRNGLQWPGVSRFYGYFTRMMYRGFKGGNRRSTQIKCTKKKQQRENYASRNFLWNTVDCNYTFLESRKQLPPIHPNLRQIRAFAVPIFFAPLFVLFSTNSAAGSSSFAGRSNEIISTKIGIAREK